MIFLLRVLLLTFLREIFLLALILAWQNFDVRPLPLWTWTFVVYLIQFFVSWLFTEWIYARRIPSWVHTTIVFMSFIFFGTIIEFQFFVMLRHARWEMFWDTFHVQHLYLVSVYALAIFLATIHIRRKKIKSLLPEGLE